MTLDIRQTIMESCALDGEGYIALKGGPEHERVKAQTELGRYKTWREMGSQIKRVKKRQCN